MLMCWAWKNDEAVMKKINKIKEIDPHDLLTRDMG
jgi:hypothetical protein